ncbi:IPT/TIG domain-containing protein [Winogradskyella sp. Asnod2-B02-A]|uniref:IPT/TIG domain-containing protein n=1 Tax=Winogradskyella sp. Asnod2-B02-A TaxID=3160583 RepID=UPI00386549B6
MNKKVNKIKFILKGSFIIIIMCFFTFACSSESDTNNETENSELAIIDISPNSGHIGDEVTINWSGLNETITSSNVKFNNLNADIVSINPNQLTCIVPENAISGIIELSLNQNQVFSDEDFIILENTESFNISSHSPEIPKPGYKMQLFGEGFGIEANNVQIIFKDFNGGDIDANILNINNDLIELAIPVNASNSNIEININDEVIIYEITLSDINHEPIYYFFANKFYSFLLDNNGEVNSTQESTSFSGIDQITSIAYDNMDDTFYGLSNYTSGASPKTRFVSFDDSNNSKFSTILCYCNNDHS